MTSGKDMPETISKRAELSASLLLTFVIVPAATIAAIGIYGFIVWFFQILNGPPGV